MARIAIILSLLALAGCAQKERIVTRQVAVAVPVYCLIDEPVRPDMPTDWLEPGVSLDGFVASAIGEIEVREAYEQALIVAFRACKQ